MRSRLDSLQDGIEPLRNETQRLKNEIRTLQQNGNSCWDELRKLFEEMMVLIILVLGGGYGYYMTANAIFFSRQNISDDI